MVRGTGRLEAITRQNELLAEQNDLLREEIELLRRPSINDSRPCFVDNIDRDEMRNGFLVTSQRKKLWNVQIGLINEFARICNKYNLRWFALYGTLLGAVRHKGFIPWDDDVDVAMLRPDYEKFRQIAATEVHSPYFLDVWYNYRFESEGASPVDAEGAFQFVTAEQEKVRGMKWLTQWPSIRLRDNRTTMIDYPDRHFINQGIWLDVFPLDPLPPFATKEQTNFFETAGILLLATASPALIRNAIQNNQKFIISHEELKKFLSRPFRERGGIYDSFMNKNFFMSEHIGEIRDHCLTKGHKSYHSKDFTNVTYLPFERIELPAPADYDSVLTSCYGSNWRTPIYTHSHANIYSTDIPWTEYFKR